MDTSHTEWPDDGGFDVGAFDVVVVGAGPVGLTLACELRVAGVSVLVLERRDRPDSRTIKAGVLGPLAVEALQRRGLHDALVRVEQERLAREVGMVTAAAGVNDISAVPRGQARLGNSNHFAGLEWLDPTRVRGPKRLRKPIDQRELERVLTARARDLGVELRREHEVVGFGEDGNGNGVEIEVKTPAGQGRAWGRYLVGCDGGHSLVRKALGIEFPGVAPSFTGRQAVIRVADPTRMQRGWYRTAAGMMAFGLGVNRLFTIEFDTPPVDRLTPITAQEVQDSIRRAGGVNVELVELVSADRFTDNARQASSYRKGRVFLAGDAAHVHSPLSGQGLNIGLVDAVNLGWKLAAAIHGWAPTGLLDSYTAERHPAGRRCLQITLAQSALMRPGPHTDALRAVFLDLMAFADVNEYLWKAIIGSDLRYDLGYAHPLVGTLIPHWPLRAPDGGPAPNLADLMSDGRGLLLDLRGQPRVLAVVKPWSDRVGTAVASADTEHLADIDALLIRPDGCVAWALSRGADFAPTALARALRTWFGQPSSHDSRKEPHGNQEPPRDQAGHKRPSPPRHRDRAHVRLRDAGAGDGLGH